MQLKLFLKEFVLPEDTLISVEGPIPYEYLQIPCNESAKYDDYIVIGMYVQDNQLHLVIIKER